MPSLFTGTVCTLTIYLTSHYVDPSWRSSLASTARPLRKPAQWPNVAGIPTQDPLLLHIPDSRFPLASVDGPVFPGLPMPTLKVALVSSPGAQWSGTGSCRVCSSEFSPLPGFRTSTPTINLLHIDTDFTMSSSRVLGRLSWPVLYLSICQCLRTRNFLRSPNRVRQDFDRTQEALYPLSDASPISDGHLSPASSRGSSPVGLEWAAESLPSAG